MRGVHFIFSVFVNCLQYLDADDFIVNDVTQAEYFIVNYIQFHR